MAVESVGVAVDAPDARGRWTVLAVCALALFLVGLDTTIVTVGLPAIGSGLGMAQPGLAWVIDSYTVVFASLLISAGALADRFGRRRVFLTGLVIFGASSAACAAAGSSAALLAARVAQGVGASMLTPVALAIVVAVMRDPRERAQAIGVWSSVFGISMAAGPLAGGALLAVTDWRALFWINVPVVVAAIALVVGVVPESRSDRPRPLDVPGQVALVVVLALTVTVFVAFSMTLLMATALLQERGWSAFAAGAMTLPMAAGAAACAAASGYLVGRLGPRLPLLLAGALIGLGGSLMLIAWLGPGHGNGLLAAGFLATGMGVGFANAPITSTAVAGLPAQRAGVAGGITSTARQFGTAIGVALAAGILGGATGPGDAGASVTGWVVVIGCGIGVAALSRLAPPAAPG